MFDPTTVLARFQSPHYLRHDQRRLEHLATLGFAFAGRTVLEVGAGAGDLTSFFVDRGAHVTLTEGDPDNVAVLHERYPDGDVRRLDLEDPDPTTLGAETFDVCFAYGVLYHLGRPAEALALLAAHTRDLLLLETAVFPFPGDDIRMHREEPGPENALHGVACRPKRGWVMRELRRHFPFVYTTTTQPNHEEFPIDWTVPQDDPWLVRAVFVASRTVLALPSLTTALPDRQLRAS